MSIIPPYSYVNVVRHVIQKDGVMGLFGRGLKTRLIANGMQVWSRIQFYFKTHIHPVEVLLGPRETTHNGVLDSVQFRKQIDLSKVLVSTKFPFDYRQIPLIGPNLRIFRYLFSIETEFGKLVRILVTLPDGM